MAKKHKNITIDDDIANHPLLDELKVSSICNKALRKSLNKYNKYVYGK